MNYEPLARKYRPQNFSEVVGQDQVVSALSNAIKSGRIHHAYLFAGTRGVGKTTMARILAKSLNCLNSPAPTTEICGKCDACRGIAAGSFVDVQEIDGASNRGIDEIRNLRENIRYAPVNARYKIFIIDEAHQITGAAFNALLKTLEEPPRHAVFILATTESSSIPPTIASRCQRYRFKSISEKEISTTLKKILTEEKIPFEEPALSILARAAQGSMRDAESLTEQAIAFTNRNITVKGVRELLGTLPSEMLEMLFDALSSCDTKKLIETANKIMDEGYEPGVVFADMLSVLRAMLYIVSGVVSPGSVGDASVSDFEKEIASRYASGFSVEKILRLSKLILKARDEFRWAEDVRFVAEIYLAKMTQPFLSADEILAVISGENANNIPTPHPSADSSSKNNQERFSQSRINTEIEPSSEIARLSFLQNQNKKEISNPDEDIYDKLLNSLPSSEERLRSCLVNVKLKRPNDNTLVFIAPSEFVAGNLKRKIDVIISCLEKTTGIKYAIDITSMGSISSINSSNSNVIRSTNGFSYKKDSLSSQEEIGQSGENKVPPIIDDTKGSDNGADEICYEESDFETAGGSGVKTDFSNNGYDKNSPDSSSSETLLPERIKKIKDVFQGRLIKKISTKQTNKPINK